MVASAKRRRVPLSWSSATGSTKQSALLAAPPKRRKLSTTMTNALLKDLVGGDPLVLSARVRDAGGEGWRATTRFVGDAAAALAPEAAGPAASRAAHAKHGKSAALRGSFQRVAAAEATTLRLVEFTGQQKVSLEPGPPSFTAAIQAPPGSVQSLNELEAVLALCGRAKGAHARIDGSVVARSAAVAGGRVAVASLATTWSRKDLAGLLESSSVSGKPSSEGLVDLAVAVMSRCAPIASTVSASWPVSESTAAFQGTTRRTWLAAAFPFLTFLSTLPTSSL